MGKFIQILLTTLLFLIFTFLSAASAMAEDYRLGPGDSLEVTLWGLPELSTLATIRPDGYITMPLVNDLSLDGLTTDEAKKRITDAFSVYIKEPKVTMTLKSVKNISVQVMGVVRNPGVYNLPRNEARILGAVAKAGGYLDNSDTKHVVLTHKGETQSITVDLDKAEKDSRYDIAISDGDTIVIPFVDRSAAIHGEVANPGKYPVLKTGSYLNDLIALAGGITDKADLSRVTISINQSINQSDGQTGSVGSETVIFSGDASKNPSVPEGATIKIPPKEAIASMSRVTPYLQTLSLVVTIITAIIGLARLK